jgi:hypothetical protein
MTFQDKKKQENMDFVITGAWVQKFTQLSTPTRPNTTDPQASANTPVLSVDQIGIVVIKTMVINLVSDPKAP